jgi:uncharacterized membrane protein
MAKKTTTTPKKKTTTTSKKATPPKRKRTPSTTARGVKQGKGMAVLAYLGILCLIPLIARAYKRSPFVKCHLNQGLVLFIAWTAWMIGSILIVYFLRLAALAVPVAIARFAAWIGLLILEIICIISALMGRMKPLPLIGKIKFLK